MRRRLVGRDDADVVYSQWRDNRFSVYVRYSEKGSATLTNAWKKWLDKREASCEHTVEFQSKDKNTGFPLVVRVDLQKMAQTTGATHFAAQLCAGRIAEMREEVQWDTTTSLSL